MSLKVLSSMFFLGIFIVVNLGPCGLTNALCMEDPNEKVGRAGTKPKEPEKKEPNPLLQDGANIAAIIGGVIAVLGAVRPPTPPSYGGSSQ